MITAIAVGVSVAFFALGAWATGVLRITIRRVTKDDPPRSSFGRGCSWCNGTIEPSNHSATCPIKGGANGDQG